MHLELLANELLLELFEFLDGVYLFRAFYGLNSRFSNLLLLHCRNFHFDFEHVPKEDFYIICQHLSSFADRVLSIQISNDLETPKLPELFLYYAPTLTQFTHLKSLTLHSIDSLHTLSQLTNQCICFPNLIHFNMIDCQINKSSKDGIDLFNNIWKLPKLTHCNFRGIGEMDNYLSKISAVSSSIQNLSTGECNQYSLLHLLKYTPNLRQLHTTVRRSDEYLHVETIVSPLASLKISFSGRDAALIDIFQSLPELRHLTIETSSISWNGYIWEEILDTYFSQLELFRFKMEDYPLSKDNNVDKLLDTFRTSFWLEKHQWFVGCQWNQHSALQPAKVYTLPYAFDDVCYQNECSFTSTCFDESNYYWCDHVRHFTCSFEGTFPDDFCLRFPNITKLRIDLSCDLNSLLRFVSVNQLRSLHLPIKKGSDYHRLQALLDRARRLYLLDLDFYCGLRKGLFQLTSSSVRRVGLLPLVDDAIFTSKDCINLISSPLGLQCEVLSISLDDRINALTLIQQMSNLRSIRFQYKNNNEYYGRANNDRFYWLQNDMASSCSFNECQQNSRYVDVWINRRTKNTAVLSEVRNKVPSLTRSVKRLFENLRHSK